MKLTKKSSVSCCDENAHIRNRNFVARRWNRSGESESSCCDNDDLRDMSTFLSRIKSHGFTITAMAFQDAYNLDIERLRSCSLHVAEEDRLIPFCAKYLTAVDKDR